YAHSRLEDHDALPRDRDEPRARRRVGKGARAPDLRGRSRGGGNAARTHRAEPACLGAHRADRHARGRCGARAPGGAHLARRAAHDVRRNELGRELPGRMAEATAGAVLATQPVLAADRVRFHGEPVVAIAAESPEVAAHAADLVEIEYEDLPGVYDPLAALAP